MGLVRPAIAFLASARAVGVSFENTLMVGRQWLMADAGALSEALHEGGDEVEDSTAARIVADGDGYAEPLLKYLGAQRIDSLDASDFEGSTIVHDLNEPLPPSLAGEYSLVIDSGSLEHVYNFPQAIANCLELVRVGGHFAMITPANNYLGHGFYQFSPELLHRALSARNGYRVVTMLARHDHHWARWYSVADPATVGHRVQITGPWPTTLYVIGQRTSATRLPTHNPQQSDYVTEWQVERGAPESRPARIPRGRSLLQRAVQRPRELLGGTMGAPGDFTRVSLTDVHRP